MNKEELISVIAEKAETSKKDATAFLDAFVETVTEVLSQGDKIQIVGFGTFETRQRAARNGRNPSTGEPMQIPASTVPAFRAGKSLKEAVKE